MSPLSPLSEFAHTAAKKPWTNLIVSLLVVDLALSEDKRTPPPSPLDVPQIVPVCAVGKNAVIFHRTKGGKSINLPSSGAARTRSAAATTADAFEVAPILVAPLQKSTPQGIPNRDTATVKASIDAVVLANSDNNDSGNDKYSYFGKHRIPARTSMHALCIKSPA